MRLIVTGVNGFVGRHVARLAAEKNWQVFGISTADSPDGSLASLLDDYAQADLREQWPERAPRDAVIVHLAGLAAVGPSFDDPQSYIEGNSSMVTHMCEWLLRVDSPGRVIGVSTGAVYAADHDASIQNEDAPVGYASPYAVSKLLVESQLHYYRRRGLNTVIARPFNHVGPGQGRGFLLPDLTQRLLELDPGATLQVGNLDTRRDYTDVRDVAAAYLAMASAENLQEDVYNVASGRARSGREILATLCTELKREVPPLAVDPSRIRPGDPAIITGDARRIMNELGWRPKIPLAQTINDFLAGISR